MAVEIYIGKGEKYHRCLDEVAKTTYSKNNDGVDYKKDQPIGLITRCSCGTLWMTKKYLDSFCKWKHAGPITRFKYRNEGWTEKSTDF